MRFGGEVECREEGGRDGGLGCGEKGGLEVVGGAVVDVCVLC